MEREGFQELDDIQSRLRFDYQVVMGMRTPLMTVEAYRSLEDLEDETDPILSTDEGHLATYYRVVYHITTLAGPERYSNETTVDFHLLANNNYPVSEPACFATSNPIPWSPHFHPKTGDVCLGKIWRVANGNMLLGELMTHVARLLNFDEPEYEDPNYGGWSPEAVDYWVNKLGRRPITEKLRYPIVPALVYQPEEVARPAKASPKIVIRQAATGSVPPAAATPAITLRPAGQAPAAQPSIKLRPQKQ
jgi:hypothetical protein